MDRFRKMSEKVNGHSLMLLSVSIVVFVIVSIMQPKQFLTVGNFQSMAIQLPEFGILALGMMFAMITGGVDLSLVGIANLSSIVAAKVMVAMGSTTASIFVGIAVAIIVGIACGLLNGFLIEYFKIPSMLVTLATMQLYTGISLIITKGPALTGLPTSYASIANGYLFGIPNPMIVFTLVVVAVVFIVRYTVYGKELLFYGSNQTATKYSGIDNFKVVLKTFMIAGILAAVSGVLISSHYNSAKSDYGVSYTLLTLLIVVLGGISPSGGKENISGVVISIVLLQLISSAFNILRVNAFIKTFVFGLLLIVVVLATMWSEKKLKRKSD